jgi:hypothetical protein
MTDHDEPLGEVYEGELDGTTFEALMDDLESHAQVLEVRLKNGPEEHAEETTVTLEKARMLLVLGKVHAVRVHYRHDGLEWIDTLLARGEGMRIVRFRIPTSKRHLPILA